MEYVSKRTCTCIEDYEIEDLIFHKRREYQVDITSLWYIVYQNGGWDDYIHLNEEQFNKYFKLIE